VFDEDQARRALQTKEALSGALTEMVELMRANQAKPTQPELPRKDK